MDQENLLEMVRNLPPSEAQNPKPFHELYIALRGCVMCKEDILLVLEEMQKCEVTLVQYPDRLLDPLISYAMFNGDLSVVKILHEDFGHSLPHEFGRNIVMPMSTVLAIAGNVAAISYAGEKGVDIDLPRSDGETPAMVAASVGRLDVVKFYIERHGLYHVLEDRDVKGRSLKDHLVRSCDFDCLKFLEKDLEHVFTRDDWDQMIQSLRMHSSLDMFRFVQLSRDENGMFSFGHPQFQALMPAASIDQQAMRAFLSRLYSIRFLPFSVLGRSELNLEAIFEQMQILVNKFGVNRNSSHGLRAAAACGSPMVRKDMLDFYLADPDLDLDPNSPNNKITFEMAERMGHKDVVEQIERVRAQRAQQRKNDGRSSR